MPAAIADSVRSSTSNDELKSLLYPQGATATADADHDPEFDDAPAEAAIETDPDADEADEPAATAKPAKAATKAAADATEDDATADAAEATAEESDDEAAADDTETEADETEADDDEKALRARAKFSPEQQKVVDKLMGKKTAAARELREKATKLETRAAALEADNEALRAAAPAPVATAENPLADATSENELNARKQKALAIRQWLIRHRDGGELPSADGKGGAVSISPERRDELLAETDELLLVHLPARREFLQQSRVFEGEARKAHPELADAKSELSLRVDAALRYYPALQTMPEARLFIADALAHKAARLRGAATPARAALARDKAQPGKAPSTEGRPRLAARSDPNRRRAEGAFARLEKTGRDDSNIVLANLIGGAS